MINENNNSWDEQEDRFNDEDNETNYGSVDRRTGNDDDWDDEDELDTDDDDLDTDDELDDEYVEDSLNTDYLNDKDDAEDLSSPHETEFEQQDKGNDASFSEQTDVTPPTPHEFPAAGNAKTDFASRNQGRTTGRMVGHEPGTEGI